MIMNLFLNMDLRVRYALCAVLAALSLLLLGAGKFSENLTNRRVEAQKTKSACREAVIGLKSGVSEKHQSDWSALASRNPELFVRACHQGMQPLSRGE